MRYRLGSQELETTDFGFGQDDGEVALVFGSETEGLKSISPNAAATLPAVFLPMNSEHIRSYNLANTVSIGLWEAHRQQQLALKQS